MKPYMSLAKNLGGRGQNCSENFTSNLKKLQKFPKFLNCHFTTKKVKIFFKNAIFGGGRVAVTKISYPHPTPYNTLNLNLNKPNLNKFSKYQNYCI
jgi:hypothetical protein